MKPPKWRVAMAWVCTLILLKMVKILISLANFGMRPGDYAEAVGWVGADVWHAHCKIDASEIDLFARTATGVPVAYSNMRLASGIAPVRQMLDAGVKVGLGVDGSASNDSGHMLNEARQAMLLQRVMQGGDAMTARGSLAVATRGGAAVLGRNDIGVLAPGYAADIAAFDCSAIDFAGAAWDPLAALVFCGPTKAAYTFINGQVIVAEGTLQTMDMAALLASSVSRPDAKIRICRIGSQQRQSARRHTAIKKGLRPFSGVYHATSWYHFLNEN